MAAPSYAHLDTSVHTDVELDATVTAIGSGSLTFFGAVLDNSDNEEASILKAWDGASPTLGTDEPDWIVEVGAGAVRDWVLNDGHGQTMVTQLYVAATTSSALAGTAGPANPLKFTGHTS